MITKNDVEPYVGLVEMGHNSLWFLTTALQSKNHGKTIAEVYAETIGMVAIPEDEKVRVFNQGSCLFAAYLLLVIPKEANLKAFASHVQESQLPSLGQFILKDGSGNDWNRPLSLTLNKLRNSIAHANFELVPNSPCIRLSNFYNGNLDFVAQVDMKVLMQFCEEYKLAWVTWASNLP